MPAVGEWSLQICSHLQCVTAAGSYRKLLHMRRTSGYAETSGTTDPTISAVPLHLCIIRQDSGCKQSPSGSPCRSASHPEYSRCGNAEWNAKA